MVQLSSFLGVAALLSTVLALPMPDSTLNEPAVAAPDGTPITLTGSAAATPAPNNSGCGSSGCGSSESKSQDCGSSGCGKEMTTSSSMMSKTTSSSMMKETSSTMMKESTSTMMTAKATSTSYGSGSSNWGGSGYNDCVNQCIASFGSDGTYMPSATTGSYGSKGTGATHTVIVAPSQGVLRFVPFMVNASVGDTIMFNWHANNHTVTKSSSLLPCNKTSDALFASGTHDAGFSFTQVVNSTEPTFYYCATTGHCAKGMFGIINPGTASAGSDSSLSMNMQSMMSKDSTISAMAAYANTQTSDNAAAAKWGGNLDITTLPDWAQSLAAENVLYMRTLLAKNPDILKDNGAVDLSTADSTPLMIPADINAAANAAASAPSSSGAPASTPSSTESQAPASSPSSNGAMSSMASPSVFVGIVAAVATFFLL